MLEILMIEKELVEHMRKNKFRSESAAKYALLAKAEICNWNDTTISAIAEGPRDAWSQLKSCQLLQNCTKNYIWLQGLPFHVV